MKRLLPLVVLLLSFCAKQETGPRIVVDQGHHNRHRINDTYRPFAKLLKSNGYAIEALKGEVTPEALAGAKVLVIPAAMGDDEQNTSPAFSAAEVNTIVRWIDGGGALLLITDHFPFGDAVLNLAAPLGVEMSRGMTVDPVHHDPDSTDESQLLFSRANGLLGAHPITAGVDRVMTFTGQSLRAPNGTALLRLSETAANQAAIPKVTRSGGDVRVEITWAPPTPAKGWAQAVALQRGNGRVVVLGEAAMVTEQTDGNRRIGMNVPNTGNRQFLLNTIRWLWNGS